jgi:hypothetical protein
VAKRKPALSTVVAFMSEEAQAEVRDRAGVASPLPLEAIRPDPGQPRRLLPADLAQAVVAGDLTPAAAVRQWLERAAAPDADPALKRHVQELRRLAASIEQHGLINPISVRPAPAGPGAGYWIITGERRYWAHVLLAAEERRIQEGLESHDPRRIKATVAPEGISVRSHQIIENLLREDIDAVEKAHGFMALRYELSGIEAGAPADDDLAAGGEEVNHGSPLVAWSRVEETLGISKRYRSYVTAVLKLDPEAQQLVRRHALSERLIRPISQKLQDRPQLQLEALRQVARWQAENESDDGPDRPLTAAVKGLVDRLLARDARRQLQQAVTPGATGSKQVQALHEKIKGTLRYFEGMGAPELATLARELVSDERNATAVADLQHLRQQLDSLLEQMQH